MAGRLRKKPPGAWRTGGLESERRGAEIYASWLEEDAALTRIERDLLRDDQRTSASPIHCWGPA